jgi:hypothetical protein
VKRQNCVERQLCETELCEETELYGETELCEDKELYGETELCEETEVWRDNCVKRQNCVDGTAAGRLWAFLPAVSPSRTAICISLHPLRSTWLASAFQQTET